MRVWRICAYRMRKTAFSGRGAFDNPGRWNSEGHLAVYCAESRALAAMEILVHVENKRRLRKARFVAIPAEIPDHLICRPGRFPRDWDAVPPHDTTRRLGDEMLDGPQFPALRVPSAVVHGEFCFVLNPAHPLYGQIVLGDPEPFRFDERIATVDVPARKP